METLQGKGAIVTGAASGIGLGIARALNVSDGEAVRAAAAECESLLGKVHLVFNNAGVELSGALSEALEQDLEGSGIGVSVLCPAAVRTRIAESSRVPNARLRAAVAAGMSPDAVGERVLRAIREREFYVFTHAEPKARLEARFRRILAAFDRVPA